MSQLSTGTEERTAHTAVQSSGAVNKPRHPGRRLFGNSDPHPPQAKPVPEESALPGTPEVDLWEEGRVAARSGNHESAMTCFLREGEARSAQGSHGRAAIAFRTAAEQARLQGLAEKGEQLLHRAATAYTEAAEGARLTPVAASQAWISAAKCFLQLQLLDRATLCIEQARRVAEGARPGADQAQTAP